MNGEVAGAGGSHGAAPNVRSDLPTPLIGAINGLAAVSTSYSEDSNAHYLDITWNYGGRGSGLSTEAVVEPKELAIGRFLMMSRGLTMLDWGNRWLIGLNPDYFGPDDDIYSTQNWRPTSPG